MNALIVGIRCLSGVAALAASLSTIVRAEAPRLLPPPPHTERVLVSGEGEAQPYLAFPALLNRSDDVLVCFKRGRAHGGDAGAVLDAFRLDKQSGRVSDLRTIAQLDDKIMQMGEWVRFPNGDIDVYIDAQEPVHQSRIGLRYVRSRDGGRTFGPVERVGPIDGVEYGYPFDTATDGRTTWMLVMTFSNLTGGKSVDAARPQAGAVCVIRSDNSGRTWHFVRDLTHEFGDVPINESALLRVGNGFVVSTRGYDNHQRIERVDGQFHLRRQLDLTATYSFIQGYVGRPRLFARDGGIYLLGRNWTQPMAARATKVSNGPNMPEAEQLGLFRLDPETLAVSAYATIDNAERKDVTDGYYAVPYFRTLHGQTLFDVITYKGIGGRPPQIVELEYHWDDLR